MIGMMYLVLTALLALNVSVTVLDKFVFINESLNRANEESAQRNVETLTSVKKSVEETGNREKDVAVIKLAEELRAETVNTLNELTKFKIAFIEETGGYEEGHDGEYPGDSRHLIGKTNYDVVGHYMMAAEEGGQGHGVELETLLDGYVEKVKAELKSVGFKESDLGHFEDLALDADDHPVFSNDPNQQGKKFAQLEFEGTPTPAGIASISEFQARILSYETQALDMLRKKVGAGDLNFDEIKAMVRPEAKYVAAGTPYKAEMFIAASSSGVTPTMTYNGTDIPVSGGVGQVEFIATPGNYDENGNARKTYEAAITVKLPGGQDTTFTNEIEYYVIRPVIQIQSQSVNALYLNCGNALDVQVPALGTSYSPRFTASGADVIPGQATGQVTIVPKKLGKIVLGVSSNGNKIGDREFGVRGIPAPDIVPRTDRGPVDLKTGISAKTPRIYLQAVPDKSFLEFLPNDAKFRVAEAEITLVSGGLGRRTIRQGERVNLGPIAQQARKGDQLVIEIKKVQRQNFRGQVEDFPISKANSFINITLK